MKKLGILSLLACFCLVALCGVLVGCKKKASVIEVDGFIFRKYSDKANYKNGGYVLVEVSDKNKKGSVEIPRQVKGKPVLAINTYGFRYSDITSVTIPDTVQVIYSGVFEGCRELEKVTIEDPTVESTKKAGDVEGYGLNTIYQNAFSGCKKLVSINIPKTVRRLGECVFKNCTSLSSVSMQGDVLEIRWSAFENCTSLTSVNINMNGDINSYVGASCFKNCTSLVSSQLGELNEISSEMFAGCSRLQSVLASNVSSIEALAFEGCSNLTTLTVSDRMVSIGDCAFKGCTSLTSCYFDNRVPDFGQRVFRDSGVQLVVFGENLNWASAYENIPGEHFDENAFGVTNITFYVLGNDRNNVYCALSTIEGLAGKENFDVCIDSSLIGQIENTFGFASIQAIPEE